MKIEYELEEIELLKELDNIHIPVFKEESIEEKETENEKEEDNTRIYTSKIFKDFNELYEYILDISSNVKKNIPKYNAKLFKIYNLSQLEKLNSSYRRYYDDMYRRLDKIEVFLHLRKSLNVSDNNIVKNNNAISKDVMKIKRVLFSFSVKLVLKKEMFLEEKNNKKDILNSNDKNDKNKEKLRQKEERERKRKEEDKKLKYIKEQQDTILRKKLKFNKNILYLKRYGIEDSEKVLDNNLELFLEIYNAYSNIYTKEELFEKIVGKSKVIRSDWFYENAKSALSEENILKYLFLKKKIIEKKLLLKKNIERLSKEKEKEVEKDKQNKKEKENNYNIITVEKANEIILNALKVLGKEYTNTLEGVFKNNQIDYFKRKNKQRTNTTMAIYDGYILLQNDRKKDINIYTYIHELGHLIRYMKGTFTDVNAVEEMFAIFNEKLLFNYLKEYTKEYEEEKKTDDDNNNKNYYNEYNEITIKKYMILVCDGLLNFLDMTFNTLVAYIFQEEVINRIYEGDNNIEELKKFALNKMKDILETMKKLAGDEKEDKKELYDFLLTNVYLKPYYPITYYLAVVLTFNISKEIKQREENSINCNSSNGDINRESVNEIYNLICNDNLSIDSILEEYNICAEDIFNIFELLEHYKNASKKI